MLIMTKDREILNLDNVLEIRASEENVECELMNGYIYIIQSFKTHKKAEDALDKILNQYDKGLSSYKGMLRKRSCQCAGPAIHDQE